MTVKNKTLILICLLVLATATRAQTGGPGQPEFMQFKPATASDLVNTSTGSFSYNIPLFDVGGYPVNLSYSSGIGMEDVASIVGLGWNINIGAISHNMRGLPDDFKGDPVKRTIYMKPNTTYGGNVDIGVEVAGFGLGAGINAGFGIFYNNYNGYGAEENIGLSFSMHKGSSPGACLALGMKANSQSGVDLYAQPSVSMQLSNSGSMSATGSLGATISINSSQGMKTSVNASMDLSANISHTAGSLVRDANTDKLTTEYKDVGISESVSKASAAYSFSKTPEIPRVTYPFTTTAYNGSFKVGGEFFFTHPHGELKGYYTSQALSTNVIITPAYGFLYEDQAPQYTDNVLLDFNREKDTPYIKDASINIGIPFYTNDIYSVNAQGISGSFQLNRGDIGVIFDNHVVSSGDNLNIGTEYGAGNAIHIGADISNTTTFSSSGKWNSEITPNLKFIPTAKDDLYQSAYFKNASDISIDENSFFDRLGRDRAVKVKINDLGPGYSYVGTIKELIDDYGDYMHVYDIGTTGDYVKHIRDPRTINIQYKTAEFAKQYGLEKTIREYEVNNFGCNNILKNMRRDTSFHQLHHISEITSTNTDGMQYVFGLPTYNTKQKEVSFTLEKGRIPTVAAGDGLVTYSSADQNWGNNGKDGFYESTELPPYVTSHLLTAVLSPDYIDIDNNGPSLNDVGNYVKINYSFAGNYNWRTPYGKNKATFNKAFLSDDADNKASYVYGEKELWYTHSIESKTEIAEFYYDTSGRKDGLGVKNEDGEKNINQKLYKLDSIKVFSINERVLKGSNAIPIRIIHFTYDYELCPRIHNSSYNGGSDSSGKLTLKKVSFSSGKSNRELLSPYRFSYGDIPNNAVKMNPLYNPRDVNRFGNLQHNSGSSDIDINTSLSNIDFPYPSQDEKGMTDTAYAWNLTKITLPGSGTISVEYEPHHYAYTQDQRCMQMFKFDNTLTSADITSNSRIYFDLQSPIIPNTSDPLGYNQLLYKYFNNNLDQYYYYKALVNLTPQNPIDAKEWISGYCKIQNIGLLSDNTNIHAFIDLKLVCKGDGEDACGLNVNPIIKNAWQFMRMNRPSLCYGGSQEPTGTDLESFIKANPLGQVQNQIAAFFSGFNNYASMPLQNFAATLDPTKSFFRLYSPDKNKIIGGSRVKRIISDDNWIHETNGSTDSKSYTTDYEYTNIEKDPVTGLDDTVSTGVMEYEPFNGQDENPMRQPNFIDQQIKMAPDNRLYVESPLNESLFPGSNLMYSKVKVISNKTNFNVPGTGHQEIECYTAKDFPVITDHTLLGDNHEKKTDFLESLVGSIFGMASFHDYITLSQGFSITLNDMHGKQKETRNYNSHGALISSEKFEYSIGKTLSLIDQKDSIYRSDKLGVSTSAICDSRLTEHSTEVSGVNMNLDMAFLPFVPLTLFVPLPNMSIENDSIKTIALNKINYKKGILTKKTVTENGASVSTENLLFDDKTGYVVLSKTTNEFNDTLFKFHYPAHWIYAGLSAGYLSSDLDFKPIASLSNNYFKVQPNVFNALAIGDEVVSSGMLYSITNKVFPNVELESMVIGTASTIGTNICHVMRSGRKNQLMQEAGSVVTRVNPMNGNGIVFSEANSAAQVINASMQEFADTRVKYCNCDTALPPPDCSATTPIPVSQDPSKEPVPPAPVIVAAKFFLGVCSDTCLAVSTGPWNPGSTIRWRIAVANVGNMPATGCKIADQLPANFSYLGNPTYFYGMASSPDPKQPFYCATSTTPPVQITPLTQSPTVGDVNLVWKFQQLPFQNWSMAKYFIIDFDVKVGASVPAGKYCNNFTFYSTGATPLAAVSAVSNNAQVTIASNSSNALGSAILNPYFTGERGNWYPTTTWSYLTSRERSVGVTVPETNIRVDGAFASYGNFWNYHTNNAQWLPPDTNGWQWVETVTKKDVNGLTLETRDVLDRHNALLTGYRNKLVVAEVGNATTNEIFFDGFEDWNYLPISSGCDSSHPCVPRPLNLDNLFALDVNESHSGKYSGKLLMNGQGITFPVIDPTDESQLANASNITNSAAHYVNLRDLKKIPKKENNPNPPPPPAICVGKFAPLTNKKYVISAWVHDTTDPLATNFGDPEIKVDGSIFKTSGNIIDGWQRIYGEFITPSTPSNINLSFISGAGATWFDDIRIFPFDSKMITHVYDGNTQKLTFTSDENNYFTKYNYDAADNLESINKETEKGVQTIKEARSANVKK